MKYPERDPLEVYAEARDRQDEQRVTKADIGRTHARQVQVSIGYQELAALLLREFRTGWEAEWESPDGQEGGFRLGSARLTLYEAEEILAKAIAASLVEMRDVRVLNMSGGGAPDVKAERSSPRAAPSALTRFWNRMRRNPWL